MTISSNQAHDFWNKGYCVNRIDVSDVLHAIEAYAAPRTLQYDFGTDPALNFPCIPELGAINELAVNELLITAAQTFLGSSVKLIQCVGWAKHGLDDEDDSYEQSNSDQRMHFDAYNNTANASIGTAPKKTNWKRWCSKKCQADILAYKKKWRLLFYR